MSDRQAVENKLKNFVGETMKMISHLFSEDGGDRDKKVLLFFVWIHASFSPLPQSPDLSEENQDRVHHCFQNLDFSVFEDYKQSYWANLVGAWRIVMLREMQGEKACLLVLQRISKIL